MSDRISIIIRTKNEERWITQCLRAVFEQTHRDIEVILVDNRSTDKTLEKARQFPIAKVLTCTEYRPGKALSLGIRASTGRYLACLSGHCIPAHPEWLAHLLRNFADAEVAGVYGRQEPMSFTPAADKRDLALVFGLDRKVQRKDSFFHNANSMLRRDCWDRAPFDEQVTNIEDRIWGRAMLRQGMQLVYEPEARVYHYHGIHQNGDEERCANVVRIMETLDDTPSSRIMDLAKMQVVALVPVRGPIQRIGAEPLLRYTIERARAARHIGRVIVASDDRATADLAVTLGAEAPFLRDPMLSREDVDIVQVLHYSLEQMEARNIFPDLIVSLEVTFPFRPQGLLDDMILQVARGGFDSVVAVRRENRAIWKESKRSIILLDEGITPREMKAPTYLELRGLGCVTHPEFLRQGDLLGEKIGIREVNNPYSHLEVRGPEDIAMAQGLIPRWFA
ncbi:MAG: glycosyltransferase family 2 protein [Deltaproteobacteria bacterium]|nr:glycosyltransferase family 2 protein [Deltaproteobacteria bacterium]